MLSRVRCCPQDLRQGFTVIELLIAISIFSVLAVMLYSTFASGLRIMRQSEKNESLALDMLGALDLIATDLENMVSYEAPSDLKAVHKVIVKESTRKNVDLVVGQTQDAVPEVQTGLTFSGDSSSFSFLLPTPEGLRIVRYETRPQEDVFIHQVDVKEVSRQNVPLFLTRGGTDENRQALVREEVPFSVPDEERSTAAGFTEVIFDDLPEDGVMFSYALRDPSEPAELLWKETWTSSCRPWGVRVEITLESSGPAQQKWVRDILIPARLWSQQECKE